MNKAGMRWIRILHIFSVSIWFGTVVCILGLVIMCFFQLNKNDFLIIAPLVPKLYQKIVMPAAIFTIIQGIIYGFFSSWGFFKYKWVLLKWIFVLLIILCTGLGGISQMVSVLAKIEATHFLGGFADGGLVLLFVSLQILFMLIMIVLSVFKPRTFKPIIFPEDPGCNLKASI
ncbi:MAG TPA: hypothetical protein DDZ44_08710 [Syntrophomonas wolfei]|uniref:DUF2269 domain-containing protein n=1 Tax=Syntrophomonas wolfei TaxID=863 RepID=A0A354Z0L3_9FIRM|nr:hypothetical protein [Syntrophomonas wolfei]